MKTNQNQSESRLKAPLEITEEISGIRILAVQSVEVDNNYAEYQYVGSNKASIIEAYPKKVQVRLVGQFSEDTDFEIVANPGLFTLKFVIMDDYYILKDAFVQSFRTDIEEDGNPCMCTLYVGGTNIVNYSSGIDVQFKDINKTVPIDYYLKVKREYREPMNMTFTEFKKALTIEAL